MNASPATIERMLEALSVKTDFRDGILGDLAEEFGLRAERDGEAAARRWYFAEALRSAPHLVVDWARGLRKPDVLHLAKVVFASFVLAATLLFFVELSLETVANIVGVTPMMLTSTIFAPPAPMLRLGMLAIGALMGGCIAAWLDDKAPLISALALGALWTCFIVAGAFVGRTNLPVWYAPTAALVLISGTAFGGVLYIRAEPIPAGRS